MKSIWRKGFIMQIEKKVPVPKIHPRSEVGRLVEVMEAGDSIFVETYNKRQQVANAIRAHGWQPSIRKYEDGHRIWRMN